MKLKNNYIVKVFIPTEYTLTTECGIVDTKLCTKDEYQNFTDLDSGKTYTYRDEIGYIKVINDVALSEYYYKIGLRKKNNYQDQDLVHELVQAAKRKGKL